MFRQLSHFGISCVVLLCASSLPCLAQFSGSIDGTVTDQSGGTVSNAALKLTNPATSVTQEAKSDNSGNFRFVSLAPGPYRISVTAPGFGTSEVSVTLTTGQDLSVPLSLSVAGGATSIDVTAATPLIDTSEIRNQQTIAPKELEAVPLAGRNMINLVTLAPGVSGRGLSASGSPGSAADNFATEQQVDASANGRSSNANMYVVDGLDVTSNIRPGVLNLTPNPDAIQESTAAVNTYSSEYGRGSSIIFTETTKSGTDTFHGLVSDYFTNQYLWAGTEFNHSYLPFHSNNVSAAIGGPIVPHHQFFFFFAIEPLRSSQAVVNSVTFEDPQFTAFAQRAFPNTVGTQLLTNYPPAQAIATGVNQTAAQAFPTTCGTAATAFLPCSTPIIDNGVQTASNYRNGLQYAARIDKYFKNDRIYGNYFRTTLDTGGPNIRTAFNTTNAYATNSIQVNETHTITSTTLNEGAFAYLKVEGTNSKTGDFSVPSVNVNGINGFGVGFAQGNFIQHSYHWRDVLSHIQGNHTLRFGYDGWHGDDTALFAPVHTQPNFQFNNLIDLVSGTVQFENQLSYNPVTGKPQPGSYGYSTTTAGAFGEDIWKAKSNLTVTIGMRWDNFGNPYATLSGTVVSNFHLGSGGTFSERVANGFVRQQDRVLDHSLWKAFAPRVGVAWDPSQTGSWVVRGGFGVYHDMPTLGNLVDIINGNPPNFIVPTFFSDGTTAKPIFAFGSSKTTPIFPYPAFQSRPLDSRGGIPGAQILIGAVQNSLTSPTTLNFSATLEHKIFGNLITSFGYAGSHSYNIITGYGQTGNTSYGQDINRFAGDLIQHNTTSPTRLLSSFGSINYEANGARANYNALITDIRGRVFKERFYFDASYTHSRSSDNSQVYPTYENLSQYYSPSAWDAPDRFSLLWNYDFPVFGHGHGLLGRVLSGWSLSGTSTAQNGNPFTVVTRASFQPLRDATGKFIGFAPGSGDYNADGFNLDYPNVSTYKLPTSRSAFLNGLFSPGIVSQPGFGTEGNEKPNRYRNPGFAETDASLIKSTAITERVSLQLRFEYYNIFNHPNLNGVDSDLSSGNFGRSTSQAQPRWLQLGAKIYF
jgi:carboxypeptidase family protein